VLEFQGLRFIQTPATAPWLSYEVTALPSFANAGTVRETPGSTLVGLARWLLGWPCFLGPLSIHESIDYSLLMTLSPLEPWSGRTLLVWDALGTLVGRVEVCQDSGGSVARITGPALASLPFLQVEPTDTGFQVAAEKPRLLFAQIQLEPGEPRHLKSQPVSTLCFADPTVDQPFLRMLLLATTIAVDLKIISVPGLPGSQGVSHDHARRLSATAATVPGATASVRAAPTGGSAEFTIPGSCEH